MKPPLCDAEQILNAGYRSSLVRLDGQAIPLAPGTVYGSDSAGCCGPNRLDDRSKAPPVSSIPPAPSAAPGPQVKRNVGNYRLKAIRLSLITDLSDTSYDKFKAFLYELIASHFS